MAQGHGFRDICAISITVRMVLGACRKLNFWRFVFKVPNISRLINKCLEIPHLHSPTQHQICCQSSTKSAQFIACRCYRHDFSSAVFAYIDQHQGWANAAQEHVAAINQNLGVVWIHFQSSVFFGCSSISEKRNFQSHLYTMCWRIDLDRAIPGLVSCNFMAQVLSIRVVSMIFSQDTCSRSPVCSQMLTALQEG